MRADRRDRDSVPGARRVAGMTEVRQQAGGQVTGELGRPLSRAGVDQARRGGIGVLGAAFPGQPVGEQVGDQQQLGRLGQQRFRHQLEHRVERLELQPVDLVQPGGRRDALGAGVAVVHGVVEQLAARVEQAVVDRPAVDADAVDLARALQPGQHLAVEAWYVPVQPVTLAHRAVGEPVHLLDVHASLADDTANDPPAGRAEVDSRDRGHRRKAAATPASTGTCRPVVSERSPAVSTNTAAATCSGSTSRLSRVRWA